MLATPGDLPVGPDWVYEVEWDGLRVLAEVVDGGLRLVTAEGQDVTPCFPELAGLTHLVPDVVLDGTIVLLTRGLPDAEALAARLRGAPAGSHATLMLSDILRLYGVELPRPAAGRAPRHPGAARPGAGSREWCSRPVYTDGPALRRRPSQRGLPYVLAKRRDAPYRAGPATTWVRVGNGRRSGVADRTEVCRATSAGQDPTMQRGRDGARVPA